MDSESDISDAEHNSKTEEIDDNERERIRKEVSTMSFEELIKLKEKMGSKLYEQTVYGTSAKEQKSSYKRANKNRPRETSSKLRPKFKREKIKEKEVVSRDPRFDPLCGLFDKDTFTSNYKFLGNVRKSERKQLQKEYEESEDPEQKKKIRLLIQRIDNQLREQEKKDSADLKKREEREEMKEKIKSGVKPVFKKKSEKRIESLIEQYEDLKKTNKLQKHIERRTKKLTAKDRKNKNFE